MGRRWNSPSLFFWMAIGQSKVKQVGSATIVICWTTGILVSRRTQRPFSLRASSDYHAAQVSFFFGHHPSGLSGSLCPRFPFSAWGLCRPPMQEGQNFPVASSRNKSAVTNAGAHSSSRSCSMMAWWSSIKSLSCKRSRTLLTKSTGVSSASASAFHHRRQFQAVSG